MTGEAQRGRAVAAPTVVNARTDRLPNAGGYSIQGVSPSAASSSSHRVATPHHAVRFLHPWPRPARGANASAGDGAHSGWEGIEDKQDGTVAGSPGHHKRYTGGKYVAMRLV